jgi:P4 family phage/plasmid primase-like protien
MMAQEQLAGRELEFWVGDQAEIAGRLVEDLNGEGGHQIAYDLGCLWRYSPATGLWSEISKAELYNRVRRYSGSRLYKGLDKDGEERWGALKIQGASTVIEFAYAMPHDWEQGEGFFADAPRGLAFKDGFLEVVFDRKGRGKIARRAPGPEHRARVGFDLPVPDAQDAPLMSKYLCDIWGHHRDFEERVALLQEFCGAALMGLAPRYQRALLLQGPKGTGKSTFLNILSGLFPEGSVAHVKPSQFEDDNKLAALAGRRLNVVYEIGQDRIIGQDILKEVMEGAAQTVVEKYKNSYEFEPEAAHAFGCNDWPSVPGAHASFWDRWLCMQLDRTIRGTDDEELELADRIVSEDLPGLIAWALQGARRLLGQDRYTIPESSAMAMAAWRGEADAVAVWVSTACSREGALCQWSKASWLFERFIDWSRKNHFAPCSSKTFGARLRELGVESKTSNGVHYLLSPHAEGDL